MSWLFGHAGKCLITKDKVNSQSEKWIIAMHMLPNISRSKGNQTVKSDHLIEYTKCDGETITTPFV